MLLAESMVSAAMSAPTATLLCVDDEPHILAALRRVFRRSGFRVLTCAGADAALAMLAREPVDLVISDMRMPGMNGAELLEQACLRWPETRRILLSGFADAADTIAAVNRGQIWRYVAKPWNDEELLLTVHQALAHRQLQRENARLTQLTLAQNEELRQLNAGLEHQVAARTDQLRRALLTLEQANQQLKTTFLTSVTVLSSLLELRGGTAGTLLAGHGRRVARAAHALALHLGLDAAEARDVMLAGLLHDIGKIALPDALLDRPFLALPPEARGLVKRHPLIGENVLLAVAELKAATRLIRHHHERFDGAGYPDGLAADAIPLGARILAVANDFDALQLGTLTERALDADAALDWMREARGRRYDPVVVDAFVAAGLAVAGPDLLRRRGSVAATPPGRPLPTAALRPGMVLAADLVHPDGYLLLASEHVIDASIIARLTVMEEYDGTRLVLQVRPETIAG